MYLSYIHSHSVVAQTKREEVARTRERERLLLSGYHLTIFGVLLLVLILSLRRLWGFLLYGFPEENCLCLLSLVIDFCAHYSLR